MKPRNCQQCSDPCVLLGGERPVPRSCVEANPDRAQSHRDFTLGQFGEHARSLTFDGIVRPDDVDDRRWATMTRAVEAAKRFAENPTKWLVLMGQNGVGKTHLLLSIANALLDRNSDVVYVHVAAFQRQLRDGIKKGDADRLIDMIVSTRTLLLDDLGTEHATDWMVHTLGEIINSRYDRREERPTAITTNLAIFSQNGEPCLHNRYPRIASRLASKELVEHCPIVMPDYRRYGR